MQFNNTSPFPGIAWEYVTSNNEYFITTVARVKLVFHSALHNGEWKLRLDSDQGELFDSDVYYGDIGISSIRYESDYVSHKEHTDVIINAFAHAPRMNAKKTWKTSVEIYSQNHNLLKKYSLMVQGEKKYRRVGPLWLTFGRKRASKVPIRYEKAYGGTIKNKNYNLLKVDQHNPIGCGMKKIGDSKKVAYAPQVSYVATKHKAPAGFGFINRAWKSRLAQETVENFDSSHNQAAHPELIMKGYLYGNTNFRLENLSVLNTIQSFSIPEYSFYSRILSTTDDLYREMKMDTVIIDLEGESSHDCCVYLSYRSHTPKIQNVESVEVLFTDHSIDCVK
jgi:hypothetical protein